MQPFPAALTSVIFENNIYLDSQIRKTGTDSEYNQITPFPYIKQKKYAHKLININDVHERHTR